MRKIHRLIVLATLINVSIAKADGFKFFDLKSTPYPYHDCVEQLRAAAKGKSRLRDQSEIIIAAWNPENVFELQGKHKFDGLQKPGGTYQYKPLPLAGREMDEWKFAAKQKKIANVGKYLDSHSTELAHFFVAPEVESLEAADRLFNSGILQDRYDTHLIKGNDGRGINIALAVRADLDVRIEMETHRDVKWFDPYEKHQALLFSRDVPAMIVHDGPTDEVRLIILGTHYKSMRDRGDGADQQSRMLRAAQMAATKKIIESYEQKFPGVPIVLAGDFNTNVQTAPEVASLKDKMVDVFDFLKVRNRVTQTWHPRPDVTVETQLDAIMVTPNALPFLQRALVLPEFDPVTGQRMANPSSYEERQEKFPSDHRAIAMVLSGKIFR